MIHKVGTNGSAGSINQTINYVLGEKDHNGIVREKVTLLEGDPAMLSELEKTMTTKNTYVHTSLSFTKKEADMLNSNPDKLDNILASYKQQLAAGLPGANPSRLASITVRHDEADGKMHIHILTLRQDLETGKSYQPFVSQRGDIQRFKDWNVCMQKQHSLENPNSIEHQQSATWTKDLPKASAEIRDLVDGLVRDAIEDGVITNRKQVIGFLNNLDNIQVSRQIKNSISITVDGHKRPIRLTGAFYGSDFTSIKNIETAIKQRAQVDYAKSEQRLQEAMSKLAEASHHKYEEKHPHMGFDTHSNINSDINQRPGLDMVSTQPNAISIQSRHGEQNRDSERKVLDSGQPMRARQQGQDVGATGNPVKPEHRIFNGVHYNENDNAWTWKGSYGYVHVQATDNGYKLSHGSKMEWTMAAQLLADQGATAAHITCKTEQSMIRALMAHKEAGVLITGIKLNGQELSKEELRERLQDYDKSTQFTRNNTIDNRANEEGQTSNVIGKISDRAATIDTTFTKYVDNIEQASAAAQRLIDSIESELEAERQQEAEHSYSYSR